MLERRHADVLVVGIEVRPVGTRALLAELHTDSVVDRMPEVGLKGAFAAILEMVEVLQRLNQGLLHEYPPYLPNREPRSADAHEPTAEAAAGVSR